MPIYKYQNVKNMLDVAVNLCKNVIDFMITKNKVDNDKKAIIKECLNQISEVLTHTAESLEKNEYPHMNCTIMDTLSKKLLSVLSEHMSKDDAKRLSDVMKEASEVEKQFAFKDDPDTIPKIYRAAGEFKAMSLLAYL